MIASATVAIVIQRAYGARNESNAKAGFPSWVPQ